MCVKVKYSKKDAKATLKYLKQQYAQYRKEVRYYYCDECNAWHLSSKVTGESGAPKEIPLRFESKWKQFLENQNITNYETENPKLNSNTKI